MALRNISASILALCVAACMKPAPPPHDIPSASMLQPTPDGSVVRYISSNADFRRYDSVFIEPVRIYLGAAGRFNVGIDERNEVALFMQSEFTRVLGEAVPLAEAPGPNTMRLRLILVGLRGTQPLLATSSHLSIGGMALNIWRTLTGGNGLYMGSVAYLAEFYDGEEETLLAAMQSERAAHALDFSEDITALGSAKVGVAKGARHMRDALATLQSAPRF